MLGLLLTLSFGVGPGSSGSSGPHPQAIGCGAAKPEWLWCDDFEVDRLASYFEVSGRNGAFGRASGAGMQGSWAMRARFDSGQVDAGALRLAIGRTPQRYFRSVAAADRDLRDIFWRVWIRYQAGWVGGGGGKLSRATVFSSGDTWAQAAIAHVWSGGPGNWYLLIDPARGTAPGGRVMTTGYNDFAHLRWIGAARSATPLFERPDTNWHCVEAHARLNGPGAANGLFELWVDGKPEARREGLDWVGPYAGHGWNGVFLENYWNQGSPKAQERYFDNFVVSTRPIGCGDS
ncbi:MAG TPA: hypothetical protein VFU23_03540 [Gemmatimonadales bacterium]|nr:hypothetical protein [Gemmatimonadales bacterium]